MSVVAATLLQKGWRAPWPISICDGANSGYWQVLWFVGKMMLFIFFYIWLRGTLPRLRYDFFFQAEDGIRDFHVTGVQTCALPISGVAPDHFRHPSKAATDSPKTP